MKSKTRTLLIIMNIVAWIVFIGLMIKAGALLISYAVSINNPDASKDLYKGLDLSRYREQSFWLYSSVVFFKAILWIMQSWIAYLVTRLLSKLNLEQPFNPQVVKLLRAISVNILSVWLIAIVFNIQMAILEKVYEIRADYIPLDFIFLSALVYILAHLFKRGVEIQTENELTI